MDARATTIGAYLDRPVYSAARGDWIRSFVGTTATRDAYARMTGTQLACRARALAAARGHDVAYVVDHALPASFGVTELGSEVGVHVYRIHGDEGFCP